MLVYNSIETLPPLANSSITIGMFDGVHRGHQKILQNLPCTAPKIVVTFSETPKKFLNHKTHKQLISLPYKLLLLEKYGIDITIVLPFTPKLAETSYLDFLTLLKKHTNFSVLVLGEHSSFGANKQGYKENILSLQNILKFKALYISRNDTSCSKIKEALRSGDLKTAEKMLGRPHSILPEIVHFKFINNHLRISLKNILLPPNGEYFFKIKSKIFLGKIQNSKIEIPLSHFPNKKNGYY